MKVAVSIPDPIFSEADMLARQLGTSRSKLYARALAEFINALASDRLTQAINDALDGIDQSEDRPLLDYARRRLANDPSYTW